jgi:hypothetical protein
MMVLIMMMMMMMMMSMMMMMMSMMTTMMMMQVVLPPRPLPLRAVVAGRGVGGAGPEVAGLLRRVHQQAVH